MSNIMLIFVPSVRSSRRIPRTLNSRSSLLFRMSLYNIRYQEMSFFIRTFVQSVRWNGTIPPTPNSRNLYTRIFLSLSQSSYEGLIFFKSYGMWHDILMPTAERHARDRPDTDVYLAVMEKLYTVEHYLVALNSDPILQWRSPTKRSV